MSQTKYPFLFVFPLSPIGKDETSLELGFSLFSGGSSSPNNVSNNLFVVRIKGLTETKPDYNLYQL